jgi:MFS family permease
LPLSASFFFNAYQTFMLGFDTGAGKPLTRTVAHYTGSWSIGFALGPLLASFIKKNINWPSAYLAAAVIAVAIGIAAFFFKPTGVKKSVAVSSTDGAGNKSLAPAAWIGLITGWTALNMIFTYWPVHAEHLSIDIGFKGAVEFSFAMAQALAAFAIAGMPSSYYYSPRLPFAALFGIVSMMLFASTSTPLIFITAAVLFGIYTAHILNAMVFHSMVEQDKAVRRIAINEVCVGVSFLISAPFSSAIRAFIPSISTAYLGIAIMLAAGLALESVVMAKLRKKPSDDLSA